MSEIREIVTRAVIAKGKKLFRIREVLEEANDAYSILGCWVINNQFNVTLCDHKVELVGNFEIDVWYAYDDNTKTSIARKTTEYVETIRVREIAADTIGEHSDVIARVLQQPTCVNASISEEGIAVEVVFEMLVEVIGEAKMMVTVFNCRETYDTVDDFENEINEDFINETS